MSAKRPGLFTTPIFLADTSRRGPGTRSSQFGVLTFDKVFSLSSAFFVQDSIHRKEKDGRGSVMRSSQNFAVADGQVEKAHVFEKAGGPLQSARSVRHAPAADHLPLHVRSELGTVLQELFALYGQDAYRVDSPPRPLCGSIQRQIPDNFREISKATSG